MLRTLLTLIIALALGSAAAADTLVLKSGGRLHGVIEKETAEEVVIRVPELGVMTIGRGEIEEIVRTSDSPRPSPRPTPSPAPPKEDPPAPAAPTRAGSIDLERKFDHRVEGGPIEGALAALGKAAGLRIEFTEGARAHLAEKRPVTRGFHYEQTIRAWLQSLIEHTTGLKLKWVIHADRVLVGLPMEILGAAAELTSGGIAWSDTTGDPAAMLDPPGWRRPDLTRLELRGADGYLVISLDFASDMKAVLEQKTPKGNMKGYDLAEVYLDIDADEETGNPMSWDEDRRGFEFHVSVSTGMEIRDRDGNEFRQWGNIETIEGVHHVTGIFATYTIWGARSHVGRNPDLNDGVGGSPEERTRIEGRRVTVTVPYELLGLKPGTKVRACFTDPLEAPLSDHRISRAGTFTLR